jgi:hypothetical protein
MTIPRNKMIHRSICPFIVLLSIMCSPAESLHAQFAPAVTLSWQDPPAGDIVMNRVQAIVTTPSTYFETMGWNAGMNGGDTVGYKTQGSLDGTTFSHYGTQSRVAGLPLPCTRTPTA